MIRPTRGYCLIEVKKAEEVSAGGVILPDRVKDMPQRGKVLACGKPTLEIVKAGHKDIFEYLGIHNGDTVIVKRFVDNRIKDDGKELLLVKFEDILGVYE